MKKNIIPIAIIVILLWACNSKPNAQQENVIADHASTSYIALGETTHDFGKVHQNEKVTHYFTFSNTGKEPLVLINVSGNCGCTVAHFPKEAIAPSAKDSILVEYTGTKESGGFIKTITVQSNASNGTQHLNIKGELIL